MSPLIAKIQVWAYILICVAALFYLGIANARGYVPFASQASISSSHTANHFHK